MVHACTTALVVVVLALGVLIVYVSSALALFDRGGTLRQLRGPASAHPLVGHMRELLSRAPAVDAWISEHGRIFRSAGLFCRPQLVVTDLRALRFVFTGADAFHKPPAVRELLAHMLGRGVLVAEGAAHRAQRSALAPAFAPAQLRRLTGVFLDKANELVEVLGARTGGASATLEVTRPLSSCLLDIMGLAGFGCAFDALTAEAAPGARSPTELATAFGTMLDAASGAFVPTLLEWLFPVLRALPTDRATKMRASLDAMHLIGAQLLAERKAAAALDTSYGEKTEDTGPRDLLSLLVRANTASDPRQQLSDADVLAQVPTFLAAGHETTTTLLSWVLFRLAHAPAVQAALRAECAGVPLPTDVCGNAALDAGTLSALDGLPLLDAVLRETLRVDAPLTGTERVATADCVLPLDAPLVDAAGRTLSALAIPRGTVIHVPIAAVNTLAHIWGTDAKVWRPQRWVDGSLPAAVRAVPGVFGHTLTFLGGAHACIGYKFALYEAKIIVHALVSSFDFAPAVPAEDVGARMIATRPFLKTRPQEGTQLPLVVRRISCSRN